MELDFLATLLLSSLSSAAILLIATVGLAVMFGLMGVINLAHGEFIMFGAYATLFATQIGVPYPLAIIFATIVTAIFGGIVELLIIRRLYGRIFDTLLATWGLSLVLYQSAVLIFGTVTPGIGLPISNIQIGDYSLSVYLLFLILVAVVLIGSLYWLLTKTNYGITARAAIQDRETASAVGVESARINTMTFALGSGLAGFAGAILLPAIPATPNMGFAFVIKAFLAVVAAGPVTLTGTVAVGSTLGMVGNITASFWTSVVGDIVFFLLTITILRIFPLGISGRWRMKL